MDAPVIVHLGFPKSGSTSLQRKLFMSHPDISYVGSYPDNSWEEVLRRGGVDNSSLDLVRQIRKILFETDELNYDPQIAKTACEALLSNVDRQKSVVYSDERGASAYTSYPCVVSKARRVKAAFGNVKTLLVIREQTSLLKSYFTTMPLDTRNGKYSGKYLDFATWYELQRRKPYHNMLDLFSYEKIIACYETIFGEKNVLVLPLEMLRDDPQKFSEKLSSYMQIDAGSTLQCLTSGKAENVRVSQRYDRYRRLRQRIPMKGSVRSFLPKRLQDFALGWVLGGARAHVEINEDITRQINERYAQSNERLAHKLGQPLADYGYVTP